jgi:hypothetical protein
LQVFHSALIAGLGLLCDLLALGLQDRQATFVALRLDFWGYASFWGGCRLTP